MSAAAIPNLKDLYLSESGQIRARFQESGDGLAAVRERAALVDAIARSSSTPPSSRRDLQGPERFCLAALGGFGRKVLFPGSDIDLLFLARRRARRAAIQARRSPASRRELWDLRLRVSPTTRSLAECGRLYRDNLEFNMSLLDCRYLAGDARLFARLHDEVVPQLVVRERQALVQNLAELTRTRHAKYGQTIFHLEPNLKEGPGGLRDYNVACWLALISASKSAAPGRLRSSSGAGAARRRPARLRLSVRRPLLPALPPGAGRQCAQLRTPGRGRRGRHRHQAPRRHGTGGLDAALFPPCPRAWTALASQLLDDVAGARSGLYRAFEDWRSRLSNADFQVSHGRVLLRQSTALEDASTALALFEFVARHGLKLSRDAEHRIEKALPRLRRAVCPRLPGIWERLRVILSLRYAADALRALHRTGLLTVLLPEFHAIDALVIRDYYHRYTVDEHSFLTIENLHRLRQPEDPVETSVSARFWPRPSARNCCSWRCWSTTSARACRWPTTSPAVCRRWITILARLALDAEADDTVRFLVANHLEMSMTLSRRDIFDPETVRGLAAKIGTPERLKMLCLLTYADIKSVNPEALTPWKAEMLWQLYAATINHMNRSLDDERLRPEQLELEACALPRSAAEGLNEFLAGFPKRYLLTHSPAEITEHLRMATALAEAPGPGVAAEALAPLRTDAGHVRPPYAVRHHRRHAGGLGHEHRQGGCVLQPGRDGAGHVPLHRSVPHLRSESVGDASASRTTCSRCSAAK